MKFLQSLYECLKKVKLPGNGYENEIKVNVMLDSQLQSEYRSNECRKLLETFKKRELKLLGCQSQNLHYNKFQERWLDLITDIALSKVYKNLDKQIKKSTKMYHAYFF